MSYCTQCGNKYEKDHRFCMVCSSAIKPVVENSTAKQPRKFLPNDDTLASASEKQGSKIVSTKMGYSLIVLFTTVILLSVVGLYLLNRDDDITTTGSIIDETSISENKILFEAQLEQTYEMLHDTYDYVGPLSDGRILVKKDGYFGYTDIEGEIVIPITYSDGKDFEHGRAVVSPRSLYGVINTNGDYVLSPDYENIVEVSDQFILISGNKNIYLREYSYYLLFDIDGKAIVRNNSRRIMVGDSNRITAQEYHEDNYNFINNVVYDHEGNYIFSVDGRTPKPGVWGMYPSNRILEYSEGFAPFLDQLAPVLKQEKAINYFNGIWTFLDLDGNWATDKHYAEVVNFEDGFAYVLDAICFGDGGLASDSEPSWKVIDNNFNVVSEFYHGSLMHSFNYGNYFVGVVRMSTSRDLYLVNVWSYWDRIGPVYSFAPIDISKEVTYLSDEPIKADYAIVRDRNSNLYGLFVNGELKTGFEYTKISYDPPDSFILEKGLEVTNYKHDF